MQWIKGYEDMTAKGQYWKGAEEMLPHGLLSNISKGARYATEGVQNSKGDELVSPEQVTTIDAIMQAAGLPTSTITEHVWKGEAAFTAQEHFRNSSDQLTAEFAKAIRSGDSKEAQDIRGKWSDLQDERVALGFAKQPLSVLLKAPANQAKRERNSVGGVEFNKNNKDFVNNLNNL
jgi:hypothetical protein